MLHLQVLPSRARELTELLAVLTIATALALLAASTSSMSHLLAHHSTVFTSPAAAGLATSHSRVGKAASGLAVGMAGSRSFAPKTGAPRTHILGKPLSRLNRARGLMAVFVISTAANRGRYYTATTTFGRAQS